MKRAWFVAVACAAAAVIGLGSASCGSSDNGDGGVDGNVQDGNDDSCVSLNGCNDGGSCSTLGKTCGANGDCCSGNCAGGSCQIASCTADNGTCAKNADCCSGTCTGGKCTPLSTSCKTLGNPCSAGGDCCSKFCQNGICAQPSYCSQIGDVCGQNSDCCTGLCTKTGQNQYGLCTQPQSGGCDIDGVVCGGVLGDAGFVDGSIPACGGSCCSRSCAPWGPTKVLVCQPASGCKPIGDICSKDSDCCGGGANGYGCDIKKGDTVGVCANGNGCKPNGDICRLQSNSCNATDDCCSGNVQNYDTCHQDNLGVPRCSNPADAGCIPTNGACATSADCCNLNPCVNGVCGGGCVKCGGACTTTADCCAGGQCNSSGTCDCPDGGNCALYGQECGDAGSLPCCNNVPCTNGRCEVPVN